MPSVPVARLGSGLRVTPNAFGRRGMRCSSSLFETGSEKYDWLNRIIAVGIGETTPTGAILQVFQIL